MTSIKEMMLKTLKSSLNNLLEKIQNGINIIQTQEQTIKVMEGWGKTHVSVTSRNLITTQKVMTALNVQRGLLQLELSRHLKVNNRFNLQVKNLNCWKVIKVDLRAKNRCNHQAKIKSCIEQRADPKVRSKKKRLPRKAKVTMTSWKSKNNRKVLIFKKNLLKKNNKNHNSTLLEVKNLPHLSILRLFQKTNLISKTIKRHILDHLVPRIPVRKNRETAVLWWILRRPQVHSNKTKLWTLYAKRLLKTTQDLNPMTILNSDARQASQTCKKPFQTK
jgi:hypothetical protein